MDELDKSYLMILRCGLVGIRNDSRNGDLEFCNVMSEYLHEIPTLIGEPNRLRHIYQAGAVRQTLLVWAKDNGRDDILEFVNIWFASALKQIDAVIGTRPSGDRE